MAKINNPHDQFVKAVLSQPDLAASFLTNYLPSDIVALFDTSNPKLVNGSFVDPELREHQSDLLFQVKHRNDGSAYIYILFEHKSYPDQWVAMQLLRYMVRIWETAVREEKVKKLPTIFPLVFYHGESAWTIATEFSALFDSNDENVLQKYSPRFDYLLINLPRYNDEEIIGEAFLRVTLLLLKYISDEGLGPRLPDIFSLYPWPGQKGLDYLQMVLRYLSVTSDKLTQKDLRHALGTSLPEREGALMPTLAEQWINEGRLEGKLEGVQEGERKGVARSTLRFLRNRLPNLGPDTEARVLSLSVAQLENLSDVLYDFQSPDDLTDWLNKHTELTS